MVYTAAMKLQAGAQLKAWTLDIVDTINARNPRAALDQYASSDYIYENTEDDGNILCMDIAESLQLRELIFERLSPDVSAEVLSSDVQIDWSSKHAKVWVGLLVHNDRRGLARERMNIFYWRLEEHNGEEKWVWWKEHTSAGFARVSGI